MQKSSSFSQILLLSCLLLFSIFSQAQNGSLDPSFGNAGKVITDLGNIDGASAVAIQSDGKILVAGGTNNAMNDDFALVRYNTNGTLDNSFGNGGIVITDIDSSETAYSMAIQPNGKIILAGKIVNHDFALVRYNNDGTLDNSFGNNGKLITDISGSANLQPAIVIQSDGKIVLASRVYMFNGNDIVLIRYNTNGTLDNTFANGGIQTTDIAGNDDGGYSIALQTDGKIVVCGYSVSGANTHVAVIRYNNDGTLDNAFGTGGIQTTACGIVAIGYSVTIQSDGKVVVGGETMSAFPDRDFLLLRYNTNGTLDNTFGNGGITISLNDSLDSGRSIAIQSDGKILFGGRTKTIDSDFRLDCYNADGTPDITFGNAGTVVTDISGIESGLSIAIQGDGKIVMAGQNNNANMYDFVMARYNYTNEAPDGLSSIETQNPAFKSYPNPFSTQTILQCNTLVYNATLLVYNSLGQQVKQQNHLYGKEIKLYRENLPAGMYTIQVKQESKTIARDKVLIVD